MIAKLPTPRIARALLDLASGATREAARMSGLGLRAGVPDLEVIHRGRALFIELKAKRGVMSQAQRDMLRLLGFCGCRVMLCRSVPEVEAALLAAGVPLRASVSA